MLDGDYLIYDKMSFIVELMRCKYPKHLLIRYKDVDELLKKVINFKNLPCVINVLDNKIVNISYGYSFF